MNVIAEKLCAKRNFLAKLLKAAADTSIRERIDNRCIELVDDIARRILWDPKPVPD